MKRRRKKREEYKKKKGVTPLFLRGVEISLFRRGNAGRSQKKPFCF